MRVQGLNAVHHAAQLPSAELSTKCVQQLANLDFEAVEVDLKHALRLRYSGLLSKRSLHATPSPSEATHAFHPFAILLATQHGYGKDPRSITSASDVHASLVVERTA